MPVLTETVKLGTYCQKVYTGEVTTSPGEQPSLQERKRMAVRNHIASVGVALFVEHGFDAVTTEQIARAADISPRSFFRYFDTKEDVVLTGVAEAGQRIASALRARPAQETAWDALRLALRVLQDQPVYPPEHLLAISRMLVQTPSLRARELEKQQHWEDLLLPHVVTRLPPHADGPDAADARGSAIIGAALACLNAVTTAWVRADGIPDPLRLLDDAIATVRS